MGDDDLEQFLPTTAELEASFDAALTDGYSSRVAKAAVDLSDEYAYLGDSERAIDVLRLALRRHDYSDDPDSAAELAGALGLTQDQRGEHGEAVEELRESVTLFHSAGNQKRRADMLYNLGNSLVQVGDPMAALDAFAEAAAVFDEMGLVLDASDCHVATALTRKASGDDVGAIVQVEQAVELAAAAGEVLRPVRYLAGLGMRIEFLDEDDATWATGVALELVEANLEDEAARAELIALVGHRARQDLRRASVEAALAGMDRMLQLVDDLGDAESSALALAEQAGVLVAAGDVPAAEGALERARALHGDRQDVDAAIHFAQGNLHLVRGDAESAYEHFMAAAGGFEAVGDPERQAIAGNAAGAALLGLGRAHEAAPLFRRLLDVARTPLARGVALLNLSLLSDDEDSDTLRLADEAHRLLRWNGQDALVAGVHLAGLLASRDDDEDRSRAERLAVEAEAVAVALPTHLRARALLVLGELVERWDPERGILLLRLARAAAQEAGQPLLEAGCLRSLSGSSRISGAWEDALTYQLAARVILKAAEPTALAIEHDIELAWLIWIKSQRKGMPARARRSLLRAAADRAVPALLATESMRRSATEQSVRTTLSYANDLARLVVLNVMTEAGSFGVAAEVIEFLNTIGAPNPHGLVAEPLWRRHTSTPAWSMTEALPTAAVPSDVLPWPAVRLSAGLVEALDASDLLPLEAPPHIRMPGGYLALVGEAHTACRRYGVTVFSDNVVAILPTEGAAS